MPEDIDESEKEILSICETFRCIEFFPKICYDTIKQEQKEENAKHDLVNAVQMS